MPICCSTEANWTSWLVISCVSMALVGSWFFSCVVSRLRKVLKSAPIPVPSCRWCAVAVVGGGWRRWSLVTVVIGVLRSDGDVEQREGEAAPVAGGGGLGRRGAVPAAALAPRAGLPAGGLPAWPPGRRPPGRSASRPPPPRRRPGRGRGPARRASRCSRASVSGRSARTWMAAVSPPASRWMRISTRPSCSGSSATLSRGAWPGPWARAMTTGATCWIGGARRARGGRRRGRLGRGRAAAGRPGLGHAGQGLARLALGTAPRIRGGSGRDRLGGGR